MRNFRTKEEIMNEYKNMPALEGSEKQVTWAENIRKNLFYNINVFVDECESWIKNEMLEERFEDCFIEFTEENVKKNVKKAIDSIFKQTKASVFIELRDMRAELRICEEIEFLVTGQYCWE